MSAEWADQPPLDNGGIPGKTLAAQREAMGWTVEQVADQLKLAVRQVIALEEGDYANLPGPAVVRGFVRAYAKILKLDAAPLVAQIALDAPMSESSGSTVRRDKPQSFNQVRFPTNGKRKSAAPLVAAVVVLALAGAGVLVWQTGLADMFGKGFRDGYNGAERDAAAAQVVNGDSSVTALPPPVDATGLAQPAAPAQPTGALPPVITNSVPLISVPPPAQNSNPSAPAGGTSPAGINPPAPAVAPAAAPAVTPAVTPAPAASASNALVLTVRQDSWIEVRSAGGKSLFSRLMKAGQIETVTVTEPATLVVGNPSGVDVTLRGAPLAMPSTAAGKVARIPLK